MSKIEWTDETWNPIVGCSKVSAGCDNCYAERMAHRQGGMGPRHYVDVTNADGWTGKIGIAPDSVWTKPLHWRKPRRIFVCSMGDLFHAAVSFEIIDRVFAVMALCLQHTFQVLTKRPERMREYFTERSVGDIVADLSAEYDSMRTFDPAPEWLHKLVASYRIDDMLGGSREGRVPQAWPLPNVWLGTTAENQAAADERIPILLDTPAAVRFVSCEPLLGPVDCTIAANNGSSEMGSLDWVIAGGESGPGARPMHPDWARSIRDQCAAAGVPFFFKQWGEWGASCFHGLHGNERKRQVVIAPYVFYHIGKKAAGRLFYGKAHDAFPEVKT